MNYQCQLDLFLKSTCYMTNTTGIVHEYLIGDLDRMSYEYFNAKEQLTQNSVIHFLLRATKVGEEGKAVSSYLIRETTHSAMKHIDNEIGSEVILQIDPATWIWKNGDNSDKYPFKTWSAASLPNICVKL